MRKLHPPESVTDTKKNIQISLNRTNLPWFSLDTGIYMVEKRTQFDFEEPFTGRAMAEREDGVQVQLSRKKGAVDGMLFLEKLFFFSFLFPNKMNMKVLKSLKEGYRSHPESIMNFGLVLKVLLASAMELRLGFKSYHLVLSLNRVPIIWLFHWTRCMGYLIFEKI